MRLKRKQPGRRKGGYTTQRGAAEYLGRSREWLRRLQLEGKGPKRSANGQYAFDDLDAYMRGEDSA